MMGVGRTMRVSVCVALLFLFRAAPAVAALGCDLNNPAGDVARLFPGSTGFKTRYASIREQGGEPLLRSVEARLGGNAKVLFAPIDVPYTIYEIYNGAKKIGYIHGVNQKGQFGGIQVFIVQDLEGKIKAYYIQKISGPSAGKLRDATFGSQFVGMSVKDFEAFDPVGNRRGGKLAKIVNPAPEAEEDFFSVLRGLKKNLILMDVFVFSREKKES